MEKADYPIINILNFLLEGKKRLCLAFLIISAFGSVATFAAGPHLEFRCINTDFGLSQNSIYCILCDRKGFMWFGTADGLNRYNGYEFKIFRRDPADFNSLANNRIQAIFEDRQGVIWIGTDNGLNSFDWKTEAFRCFRNEPGNPTSLQGNRVLAIAEDQADNLWIGTSEGLNRFDFQSGNFLVYRNDPANPGSLSDNMVTAVYKDSGGQLWVGTETGGLNNYIHSKDIFVHFRNDPQNPHSISHNSIKCIGEDGLGNLWVGTRDGGVNRYDRASGCFRSYRYDPNKTGSINNDIVISIFREGSQALWIGTEKGLNFYDLLTDTFTRYQNDPDVPNSLTHNYVTSIYKNAAGLLWVGTEGGGINLHIEKTKKFHLYQRTLKNTAGLSYNHVYTFCEDAEGFIWIGTVGKGINRFDRKTGTFIHFLNNPADPGSLSHDIIMTICEDSRKNLWIGTRGGGLNLLDRQKNRFIRYQYDKKNPASIQSDNIYSIFEDRSGTIWIGTMSGLHRFDTSTGRFTCYRPYPENAVHLGNLVRVIIGDQAGKLWLGTSDGLANFNPQTGRFEFFRNAVADPESLSDNYVRTLFCDTSNRLWVGTTSGLNLWRPQSKNFFHFSEKNGLPNNTIYGILQDKSGNLWISTNKGLSKFDPQKMRFRNFNHNDGLQSDEFNTGSCLRARDGEMFFGGVNGFNTFYPEQIKDETTVPPVFLTGFQIFNQPVPIGRPLGDRIILQGSITETNAVTLSYHDYIFSIDFVALEFRQKETIKYAYKLEGLENEWNYVGNRRFVSYSTLPPGQYTFKVKVSNIDGVWGSQTAALAIRITPPFWKTWWFIGITVLCISGMAVGTVQMRIRRLTHAKRELEQIVAERTQQLRDASLTDPLTGLRNRRFILEVLQSDISAFIKHKHYLLNDKTQRRTTEEDTVFGLFLFDIDFFKKVNDTYGHDAGDRVLKQFSTILSDSVRQDDAVMRVGGEEFLVMLKKTKAEYLPVFADKILKKVAAMPFDIGVGTTINKTCSIGYTSFPFYQEQPILFTFEQCVMVADLGLFYAKEHGRNQSVCLKAGLHRPAGEEIIQKTVTSLEFALQEGYLEITNTSDLSSV